MMESKDIISNISFKIENEKNQLVSFNAQSITFRLSIKEIKILTLKMSGTIKKSKLHPNKHRPKTEQELNNTKSNLPPNLQSFKQKLLSGNGFVEYN